MLIDRIAPATSVATGSERRWPDAGERRPRREPAGHEATDALGRLLALAEERLAETDHAVAAAPREAGVVAHVVVRCTREFVRSLRLDDLRRLAHDGGVALDVEA